MKILTAAQTRDADAYTIAHEPISSLDLMERAAGALVEWLEKRYSPDKPFYVFCGPGNNGGDGLAAARLLHQDGYDVQVFLVGSGQKTSPDFDQNLQRLPQEITVAHLQTTAGLSDVSPLGILLDGLFGSGLSRPLQGVYAEMVDYINRQEATVVAIDIPSGLFADAPLAEESPVVKADITLSFEQPKLTFFLPAAGAFVGEWHVLPIGLYPTFLEQVSSPYRVLTKEMAQRLLLPRAKFSHKGSYGHALLVGGSYGKMGAITLAAHAALRAGVGLLTVQVPQAGYTILQTAVPEAMALTDDHDLHLTKFPEGLDRYQCLGIGPGLGQHEESRLALERLFKEQVPPPLVLDADALNLLAADRALRQHLPPDSILTPHPKEFERLTGPATDDFHRLQLLQTFCAEHNCYVVLKGAHSCIGSPDGTLYFNTTGNPGMATGGAGDVLTGILTGLRAQGYSPLDTCLLGVYLHGLSGDLAVEQEGQASLIASDLYIYLGRAFKKLAEQEGVGAF
ncbi:NAD(P)H-hydrate dehydratase [Rufibacter soli]